MGRTVLFFFMLYQVMESAIELVSLINQINSIKVHPELTVTLAGQEPLDEVASFV